MNWLISTGRAAIAVACVGALGAGSAMAAEGTTVGASIDAITDTETRTDGGLATASAGDGANFASVEADLTRVHIQGSDASHFSAGAASSSGMSDFIFEVQGGAGPIELTFNFATTGGFYDDGADAFARNGGFSIFLISGTGRSPYVTGSFVDVMFGSRISDGSITTGEDYYGPGAVTTTPWLGENPGSYALTSTFQGGMPGAGQIRFQTIGGAGGASYDFELALRSVTTRGSAQGLSLYLPSSGKTLAITGANAVAVPEPSAWALMILGFGAAGAVLRRRRGCYSAT